MIDFIAGARRDPTLARSDYAGTIDVSADDARLYRPVLFENGGVASARWRPQGQPDQAYVRIDASGESTVLCGWILTDKAGASIRATRWLSGARLKVGDLGIAALFIAPADNAPGDGLYAGCTRLDAGLRPAADAPLALEGPPVRE